MAQARHGSVLALAGAAAVIMAAGACAGAPRAPEGPVDLLVAATTDVHGRLRGWDYFADSVDAARGLSRAATIVDSLRRAAPGRVILVDAGDMLQGNPLTYVAARRDSLQPSPVIAAMTAMRYDAATVGNHEFNYGLGHLDRVRAQARFPLLAANVHRRDGATPFPSRTIVERAGVRVAIIGVTTPGAMVWDRDHLKDRVVIDDIVTTLPAQVDSARAEGADVIVVVAHAGLVGVASYDTVGTGVASENPMARVAREVRGIDAIVIGHSHREVADTSINGVLIVQPRNWATSVTVVTLRVEPSGGGVRVTAKRGGLVQAAGHAEHPAVVSTVRRAHEAALAYSRAVVGRTEARWDADSARVRDLPIIDLVQEVQRRVSGAQLSTASAFSLSASLPAGDVTVAQIARLYPYENTLRVLKLSGAQVRAYLEQSARYWTVALGADGTPRMRPDPTIPGYNHDMLAGATYTVDLSRPAGQRITQLEYDGRAIAPTDSFTVAINNYRASGAGGYDMLRGAPVLYEGTTEIRELLIDEVRRRGTLRASDYHRENWRLLPPRRTLRVIAVNDFHGALEKRPDGASGNRGGAAEVAAMLRRAATECAPLCVPVLLHGGDLFQGTPASNFAYGAPVARILNALGFIAGALGNHEFDWGQDTLRARMRQLDSPVLGANVTYADGRDVPWIPDDTLVTVDGIRLGIIGIADPATPQTTMPANVADLRFTDPVPVIRTRARALRERGAERVVVVAHLGGFCDRADADRCDGGIFEVARQVGAPLIDGIVSGHTHSPISTIVNGVPIVQARSTGRAIGVLDIAMDHPAWMSARPVMRPQVWSVTSDSIAPDPAIATIVREAVTAVAPRVSAVVTEATETLPRRGNQYALGNLIADAQRTAAKGDLAVMNNGGIRTELRAGTVRWGDLYDIQPFENRLVVVTVRGDALRRYVEGLVDGEQVRYHLSGATIEYDPSAPPMRRLRRVTFSDGRRLDDRRTYRVVMTNFLAAGGDGVALSADARIEETGIVDLDALVAHLRAMPGGRLVVTEALRAPRIIPTR